MKVNTVQTWWWNNLRRTSWAKHNLSTTVQKGLSITTSLFDFQKLPGFIFKTQ